MSDDPRPSTPLEAPAFDPFDRVFEMDADGFAVSTHWVWHEASLRLGIWAGSLRSSPDLGIRRSVLKRARNSDAQQICEAEVRRSLKPMIDRGDAAILKVHVPLPFTGYFETWVDNLRDPNRDPRRPGQKFVVSA